MQNHFFSFPPIPSIITNDPKPFNRLPPLTPQNNNTSFNYYQSPYHPPPSISISSIILNKENNLPFFSFQNLPPSQLPTTSQQTKQAKKRTKRDATKEDVEQFEREIMEQEVAGQGTSKACGVCHVQTVTPITLLYPSYHHTHKCAPHLINHTFKDCPNPEKYKLAHLESAQVVDDERKKKAAKKEEK